ncbi:oligosaccharide flippase family protein [Halobacillus sp. ACCC02827]|uniref:lipopolysaccharide biosynthesis protein n=1 Tax=Halobacillus sp. ACCC02827 TaxID=3052090 RepID=UPI00256FDAF6|nr:oligosaccharide flippase family protein [Halobacillus sp. ACCC02827]WJE15267.1 oligosaccharide flippase family protein [Halobacillus sp. ACCC02827]
MIDRIITSYSILSRIYSAGLSYLFLLLLAILMNNNDFGLYNFFIALVVFSVYIVSFGMESTIIFSKNNEKRNDNSTLVIVLIQMSLIFILYIIFTNLFSFAIFSAIDINLTLYHYLILYAIILLQVTQALIRVINQSKERFIKAFLGEFIVRPTVLVIACIYVYLANYEVNLYTAMVIYGISLLFSVTISSILDIKNIIKFILFVLISKNKNDLDLSKQKIVQTTKRSFRYFLIQVLNQAPTFFLVYFVGMIGSNEKIGVFRALSQTASLVGFIFRAIEGIYNPKFRNLYLKSYNDLTEVFNIQIKLSRKITGVAVFIACVLSPLLLWFLKFDIVYSWVLIILLNAQLINAMFGSNDYFLVTLGHDKKVINAAVYQSLSAIILGFIFTQILGIYGTSLALLFSFCVYRVICEIYIKQHQKKILLEIS